MGRTRGLSSQGVSYAELIRRWGLFLVIAATFGAVTGYAVSTQQTPIYRASAKMLVGQATNPVTVDTYNSILGAERLARTYADLVKTRPVLDAAARKASIVPDYDWFDRAVEARLLRDTQVLEVSVEHPDPAVARDLANGIAEAFIEQIEATQQARFQASRDMLSRQAEQLARDVAARIETVDALRAQLATADSSTTAETRTTIELIEKEIADLRVSHISTLRNLDDVSLATARAVNSLLLVEPAIVPSLPVRPRFALNTVLAGGLGLVAGTAMAVLAELARRRVSSPEVLGAGVGLPTLAVVPNIRKSWMPAAMSASAAQTPPHGRQAGRASTSVPPGFEAYRVLRANLRFGRVEGRLRSLLITSEGPGEGKTTTAVNLSVTLVRAGFRVVLVDADVRRPSLHTIFGVSNDHGLTNLLMGDEPGDRYVCQTLEHGLSLLTAGPAREGAVERLVAIRTAQILEALQGGFDYVVVDSPPIRLASDALALAPLVDGVILVVDARNAHIDATRHAYEQLEQVGATVLGAVLNRAAASASSTYDAYAYDVTEHDAQSARSSVSASPNGTSTTSRIGEAS